MVLLHLDSRYRDDRTTVSRSDFKLNHKILNIVKARVRHVSFSNTFHNVHEGNNTLTTSSGTIQISPGFYSSQEFVGELDQQLFNLLTPGPYTTGSFCTFEPKTNSVLWTMGVHTLDGTSSSMSEVVGLDFNAAVTGVFSTRLFLAAPAYVSFHSPQLAVADTNFFPEKKECLQPFLTVPITTGYLSQETYSTDRNDWMYFEGGISLSSIGIGVFDAADGNVRELMETVNWNMIIELYTDSRMGN